MTQQWVEPPKHPTVQAINLVLQQSTVDDMIAHCQREVPKEACGLIVARDGDGGTRYLPTINAAVTPEHHWRMDGQEYVQRLQECAASGERIVAICHSHPSGPPQPSLQDRAAALDPHVHYVLVSFGKEVHDVCVTSWCIVGGEAFPERLLIADVFGDVWKPKDPR